MVLTRSDKYYLEYSRNIYSLQPQTANELKGKLVVKDYVTN